MKLNKEDYPTGEGAKVPAVDLLEGRPGERPEIEEFITKYLQAAPIGATLEATDPQPLADLQATRITPDTDGTPPPALLYINEKRAFSQGDVSFVIGPPKSRKTAAAAAVCNSLLTGSHHEFFTTDFEAAKILYIDTEQSRQHARVTFDRLTEGAAREQIEKRLQYHTFRELSTIEKLRKTIYLIDDFGPNFVMIDGMADLMTDTNNKVDSSAVVALLMATASHFVCHVCSIIHTTHANGSKGQGHAGSEAERKAETVLCVTKDQNTGGVTSKLEGLYTRNGDFAPLSIAQDGSTIRVEALSETKKASSERLIKWAIDYVRGLEVPGTAYNTSEWAKFVMDAAETYRQDLKKSKANEIVENAGRIGLLQPAPRPAGVKGNAKYYTIPQDLEDGADYGL